MLLGYARVSTKSQNLDIQIAALRNAGVEEDNIYVDHGVSGAKLHRPELDRLMSYIRKGDVIVVYKMDRICRSLTNLIKVTNNLEEKGASIKSVTEPYLSSDGPQGKLLRNILASVAEFELSLIQGRIREGQAIARDRGIRFGRKNKLTEEQQREIYRMVKSGEHTQTSAARIFNINKGSVSRLIKKIDLERDQYQ